jgi:hypothetical protein
MLPRPPLPLIYFHNFHAASSLFSFPSVNTLHCIGLLNVATLKFAVFCCSATLMWRQRTAISNCCPLLLLLFL